MDKPYPARQPRLLLIVTIATLVILVPSTAYFHFFVNLNKKPLAPAVPVISVCKELAPGMRRIGNRYGIQFDVPTKYFTVQEGWGDAIPVEHGFGLSPKNGQALLGISLERPLDNM